MNRKMKLISIFAVLSVMLFSLCGCGETKDAETAVTNMFTALKANNFDEAQKYVDIDGLFSSVKQPETTSSEQVIDSEVIAGLIYKNLDYKVVSSKKQDDGSVIVKAKITTPDVKAVILDISKGAASYALQSAFDTTKLTSDEISAKIIDSLTSGLSKESTERASFDVELVVKQESSGWKVQVTDTLSNALMSGVETITTELSNIFKNLK